MKVSDILQYFDQKTKVTVHTKDGKEYTGIFTGIEDDFDTDSGVDEMELDMGSYYLDIPLPDVLSIDKD